MIRRLPGRMGLAWAFLAQAFAHRQKRNNDPVERYRQWTVVCSRTGLAPENAAKSSAESSALGNLLAFYGAVD
jgi:hypothetical protein